MSDYVVGQKITDFFAVKKSNIGTARNDSKYLDLRLSDGKQELSAKQWDYTGDAPQENTVIKVQAMVGSYQGKIQLTIQQWGIPAPGECNPSKFIPVCPWAKNDLLEEFFILVGMVRDNDFSSLLKTVVNSPIFEAFTVAPGAKKNHHVYLHGLLEHSIDVAKKAMAMADASTNKDLLITGALLHDIGKIQEYDWSGCVITRTASGYLIGHIVLGLMIIDGYGFCNGIDQNKQLLLYHLIASHHGKLEFGSPVEPQTKEAVILHAADMLDFQVNVIDKAMAEADPGSVWTGKIPGIGREFYVGGLKPELDETIDAQEVPSNE
jgi:3'-5' exoribonuclease